MHDFNEIFHLRAASLRLASAFWWFFTLVITSSYTANLSAFLVAENPMQIIKSVEDFKECGLENQPKCKVDFGAKKGGATFEFFKVTFFLTFSQCKCNNNTFL